MLGIKSANKGDLALLTDVTVLHDKITIHHTKKPKIYSVKIKEKYT